MGGSSRLSSALLWSAEPSGGRMMLVLEGLGCGSMSHGGNGTRGCSTSFWSNRYAQRKCWPCRASTVSLLFNKLQFSGSALDFTFNITTQRALTRVILNQMVFYVNMKPVNCSQEFVYREEGLRFILFMPFMFKLSYHTTSPSFSFENVNRNYQD